MTNIQKTLWELPKNSKRILNYLEFQSHTLPRGEVTIAKVGKELGFSKDQMHYAMNTLREYNLVTTRPNLGKLSTKLISINADTVKRSDIKEMIL